MWRARSEEPSGVALEAERLKEIFVPAKANTFVGEGCWVMTGGGATTEMATVAGVLLPLAMTPMPVSRYWKLS